jgi:hypothetical protein
MIAFILVAVAGVTTTIAMALFGGAGDPRLGRRLAAGTVAALGAWLALTTYLAHRTVFATNAGGRVPWIGIAIAGVLVASLAATRIPGVAKALADPYTPARLAIPQTFRVIGATFLFAWQQGQLPAAFAIPAAVGDVAIGIAAPFIALRLRRDPNRRRNAVWFNALGILDLSVAVAIGFLAAAGPFQVLHTHPSTAAIGILPLVIIPTLLVPVALAAHIVSIQRLRHPAAVQTSSNAVNQRLAEAT